MNWQEILALLADDREAHWLEAELASERQVRFRVYVSKWSEVVGRVVVKAFLPRITPNPHGGPARYLGTSTFELKDGEAGYRGARVAALAEAYRTRQGAEI